MTSRLLNRPGCSNSELEKGVIKMGKGDKRSRRGKIFAGSYGKTRLKKKKVAVKPVEEKVAKATKKPK